MEQQIVSFQPEQKILRRQVIECAYSQGIYNLENCLDCFNKYRCPLSLAKASSKGGKTSARQNQTETLMRRDVIGCVFSQGTYTQENCRECFQSDRCTRSLAKTP